MNQALSSVGFVCGGLTYDCGMYICDVFVMTFVQNM